MNKPIVVDLGFGSQVHIYQPSPPQYTDVIIAVCKGRFSWILFCFCHSSVQYLLSFKTPCAEYRLPTGALMITCTLFSADLRSLQKLGNTISAVRSFCFFIGGVGAPHCCKPEKTWQISSEWGTCSREKTDKHKWKIDSWLWQIGVQLLQRGNLASPQSASSKQLCLMLILLALSNSAELSCLMLKSVFSLVFLSLAKVEVKVL